MGRLRARAGRADRLRAPPRRGEQLTPPAAAAVGAVGAHLVATPAELQRLRRVAGGHEPGDLAVRGGRLLAVHSGEVLERDVVMCGAFVAAVVPPGRLDAEDEIDAAGAFVSPTFIDTHLHIEYTMLTPGELARCVVPRGTTTVLADPNCIGNVAGADAMDWVGTTGTPLRILAQISHRIPRVPALELGGATVTEDEQLVRIPRAHTVTLGESNPFDLDDRSARAQSLTLALGRRNTGHTARLADEPLWAYAAGGISDDHNAFDTAEVLERLRLGMMVTVMSGSMNDNVPLVFADVDAVRAGFAHVSFCADDRHVEDLHRIGHIDHHVRSAIATGVPVVDAYRMATLNAAAHYRLDHVVGSVTPTRRADLMILDDLAEVVPSLVLVDGVVVGRDGAPAFDNPDTVPDDLYATVHLAPDFGPAAFVVAADAAEDEIAVVRAMEMYDGYFKRAFEAELAVVDGNVVADPAVDVAKIAVVDRHHGTDGRACGFVRGFGLRAGALASTTNCENQNLVVVGTSDAEMAAAANALGDLGGGYVAVRDGQVLAAAPLAVGGIMSDRPFEEVLEASDGVNAAARGLGCEVASPFMILAFVGLAGVPDYGLTERGLIDTPTQSFVPVVMCCRCPSHVHDPTGGAP